ncbi:MAG: OmpH family outer membrane protein [Bacteroidota bacterium]
MKNRLLLTLACILVLSNIQAKDKPIKIGYTNLDYILSLLPETKSIEADYKSFEKQVKNRLEAKVGEFQEKLQALEKEYETMTDSVRKQKESELLQLKSSLEQLQIESQESLANKNVELLKPVYEKIQQAIEKIAKENGYTHVFNAETGSISILLYAAEE